MKACYAVPLTFIAAKINCCCKTAAKLIYVDTPECGESSSWGQTLQLYRRKSLFQLNSKQRVCILITDLVPGSHQKGSEAAYTNTYNRIIKNNNNNNSNTMPMESFLCAWHKGKPCSYIVSSNSDSNSLKLGPSLSLLYSYEGWGKERLKLTSSRSDKLTSGRAGRKRAISKWGIRTWRTTTRSWTKVGRPCIPAQSIVNPHSWLWVPLRSKQVE